LRLSIALDFDECKFTRLPQVRVKVNIWVVSHFGGLNVILAKKKCVLKLKLVFLEMCLF